MAVGHAHFFEIDVGFRCNLLFFFGRLELRLRRRPVLVSGVHANFLTHVSAKAAGPRLLQRLRAKIAV
jgi:hypothetical protein